MVMMSADAAGAVHAAAPRRATLAIFAGWGEDSHQRKKSLGLGADSFHGEVQFWLTCVCPCITFTRT